MRQIFVLFCLSVCLFGFGVTSDRCAAADLSATEMKAVDAINTAVKSAGQDYAAGKYESAGGHIRNAMKQIDMAVKSGSPDVFKALSPAITRVSKAHAMLEFEGIALPPFRKPSEPTAMAKKPVVKQAPKPVVKRPVRPAKPTTPKPDPNAISFTKQVAPILSNRCGKCHEQGSRGGFNLATYAKLMKGPPEGVVIFAGDIIGSRLIETIETGDMPRGGGKVSGQELAVLKGWIVQGAKFDGADPNASLSGGPAPAGDGRNKTPEIKMATGKETVSFATHVAPVLIKNCNGCHIDAMRVRGGLNMDNFANLLRGGDSGEIVSPGKSAESLLIKKLKGSPGIEGEKMPAGGRPALSDKDIQLISTWIDEGATFDGNSPTQPISVMAQMAWAANATSQQMNERRQSLAAKNLGLSNTSAPINTAVTDHFYVTGTSAKATIDLVAKNAESHMKTVRSAVKGGDGDDFFHGKATIFVLPRRYDYSEFAKMVEGRGVPSDWTSHWKFDGIDAYASVVATDRDEEDVIAARLLSPIASLAVATRGGNVPRWFAEGIGSSIANRKPTKDRQAKLKREAELSEALAACKDAKTFLGNKLTPEQTDLVSAAIATTMMDRKNRKSFDACMRALDGGTPFESAFANAFRAPVNTWVNNWLKWARGG